MQKHLHYRRYRGIALHLGGVITSLWLGIPLGPLLAQHEGHGAVGAPSEGGPEGQAAMPGHAAPSALVAWLPTLFWIAIAALAVWVVVQTLRGRRPKWLRFQVALGLAAMIGTYAATAYIVKTHKRPGQMTVIEAQAMDMSVMKAPVGTAPVVTDKAGRGDFDARVTYTGTVVAFNDEDVYPRVTGWIRQMPVYPGDRVQSGQMVARLDATELGSKENEVAFARLSAEQMRAQTVAEEVQARAMRAQAAAEQTYARGGVEEAANDLASSRGMITEAQRNLAAARAMARQTEREQAGARSALRASRSEVTAAQEAKAQAEASVSDAQAELSSMEADLAAAQANAASWRPRLKRSEALEQKGAISLEELQRDQADAQAAESMVSAAAAKVRRAKAGVSSAEAAVRQAAAMVGAAEAKQEQMQAEVDAAQAKLEQAHANAEAMDAKITQARASAGAAQARVTQMQAMLGKSDASVRGAVAGIDAAARKRMGAGAAAEQMRAALTTASVIKGYTEIRASGPGVVTQRLVSPGVLVNPGTPILRIAQIDRVRLQANVAEKDVAGIRVGSPVRVTNMKDPGSVVETKVTAVFPAADPSARTVVVEALASNPGHRFLPGQFISMEIATQHLEDVVTVPGSALVEVTPDQTGVFYTEKEKAVWVVRTRKGDPNAKTEYYCTMHPEVVQEKPGDCPKCLMKLEPRTKSGSLFASQVRVKVGPSDGKRTVILSGLQGGEEVITAGHRNLREGDAVAPRGSGSAGADTMAPGESSGANPAAGPTNGDDDDGASPAAGPANDDGDGATVSGTAGHSGHSAAGGSPAGQGVGAGSAVPGTAGQGAAPTEAGTPGRAGHGAAPTRPAGKAVYTCPMHPEVLSDKPGQCPKCGMRLEKKAGTDASTGKPAYFCPMHPEVTSDKPGQTCPKCNMRLEPKKG